MGNGKIFHQEVDDLGVEVVVSVDLEEVASEVEVLQEAGKFYGHSINEN